MNIEALDPSSATEFIRNVVKHGGEIQFTDHVLEKMDERGFDIHDVMLILSNGEVTQAPEYDEKRRNFKYRITGPTLDGDDGTAILVLLDERSIRVITIFGADGGQ